jgi:hypothetical protein
MSHAEEGRSLFVPAARRAITERLERLGADSARQWGKMQAAQMLAHCALALELPMDHPERRQILLGKILARFVRGKWLGEAPFERDSPTDPSFVVSDARDFAGERARLLRAIERFAERGPERAAGMVHTFFGRLSGEEWGRLMYKHLDHHLRQFGG